MLSSEPSISSEILPELTSLDSDIKSERKDLSSMATESYMSSMPSAPPDSPSVILEVRPGTGGDEATIFAMELFRAYEKVARAKDWR